MTTLDWWLDDHDDGCDLFVAGQLVGGHNGLADNGCHLLAACLGLTSTLRMVTIYSQVAMINVSLLDLILILWYSVYRLLD